MPRPPICGFSESVGNASGSGLDRPDAEPKRECAGAGRRGRQGNSDEAELAGAERGLGAV